jgi:CBS domain containing-hemolysin-like protein
LGLAFALNFVVNDVLMGVLARRAPDRFLVSAQPLLEVLRVVSAPLRIPLVAAVRALLRVSIEETAPGAREEVRETVVEGQREGALSTSEADMIKSIMDLASRTVADILVPRAKVSMLQADTRVVDAIAFVRDDGHSRIPVYGKDRDDVLGMLYARDLLAHAGRETAERLTVKDLMRPAYFIPETKRLPELLGEMRSRKNHLAVVVNEIRATAGVVSIEDVLEEIVGDIQDESDVEERKGAAPEDLKKGGVDLDARTSVEDANRALALALPVEGDYDTVGGLLLHRLGKVPKAGERLALSGVTLTVTEADERRVKRVKVQVDGA